jgi:hypothetical protein
MSPGEGEQNNKELFGQTQTVWLDERDKPIQFRSSIPTSVADPHPDPPDPHVFGPPGSGSISQRYDSGSGSGSESFHHKAKEVKNLSGSRKKPMRIKLVPDSDFRHTRLNFAKKNIA